MLRVEPNVYSTPDTMDFKELSRTKLFELPWISKNATGLEFQFYHLDLMMHWLLAWVSDNNSGIIQPTSDGMHRFHSEFR